MLEVTPCVFGEPANAENVARRASLYDSSSSSIVPSLTDYIWKTNDFWSPGVDDCIKSHFFESLIDLLGENVLTVFALLPGIR